MLNQDGHEPRTDANADAQRALYALLAGAEGRETAARTANDDETAEFLCRVQDELVGEAKRHLERRVAE